VEIKQKQRIIGVLVLVAVAIIIIFMFSGHTSSKQEHMALSGNIPPAPEKPAMQLAIPPTTAPAQPVASSSTVTNTTSNQPSSVVFEPSQQANNALPVTKPVASHTTQTPVLPANTSTASATANPASVASTTNINKSLTTAETRAEQPSLPMQSTPKIPAIQKTQVKKHIVNKTEHKKEKKINSIIKTVPLTGAWVVQLGSFSDKTNVQKLIKQLRAKGFAAYTRELKTKQGVLLRVLIGPELRRVDAEKTADKLQKILNIKGMVLKADNGLNKK
jgi:DedD protein